MAEVKTVKGVRALEIKSYIVEFTDKEDGEKKARVAFIIGEEVRFLNDDALSGPAQSWLADNILKAIGASK